jgi:hypothetical protein
VRRAKRIDLQSRSAYMRDRFLAITMRSTLRVRHVDGLHVDEGIYTGAHDSSRTRSVRLVGDVLGTPELLSRYFRCRGRFFRTGAGENAGQSVVALVTGVFVDSTLRRSELILAAPRLVPHGRILDGELIE